MSQRRIGSVVLQGPYRPRQRPRSGRYFRPVVLLTSALLSVLGLTVALAHLLYRVQ